MRCWDLPGGTQRPAAANPAGKAADGSSSACWVAEHRQEGADWRMVRAGMPAQFGTMGTAAGGLLDWNRAKRPRGEELEDQERPRKQTRSVSQREPD